MTEKKPSEIECHECKTIFRLWVPVNLISKWKNGENIACIKCGTHIGLEKNDGGLRAMSKQTVEAAGTPTGHILIVDDDGLVRKMAENVFKKNKLKSLSAQNAADALGIIEKNNVSVVVVDLHLKNPKDPESIMNGEAFLQNIADLGRNIPAIVTTGKDLIDDIILEPKWFDLHVKAFIQKGNPYWTEDLLTKIREILKKD